MEPIKLALINDKNATVHMGRLNELFRSSIGNASLSKWDLR
jgi:hypothetical protein